MGGRGSRRGVADVTEGWLWWNGERPLCPDCGRAAEAIERSAAVAIVSELTERFMALSERDRSDRRGSAAAVGTDAARAAEALSRLDGHLRHTSVLDGAHTGDVPGLDLDAVGLFESAARLVWTINATPEACWYRRSRTGLASNAEAAWIGLHRAIHCLEDAEIVRQN